MAADPENGQIRLARIDLGKALREAAKATGDVIATATSVVALETGATLREPNTDAMKVLANAEGAFGRARLVLSELRRIQDEYDVRTELGERVISTIRAPSSEGASSLGLLELPQRTHERAEMTPEGKRGSDRKGEKKARKPRSRIIFSEVQLRNLQVMVGDVPQEFRGRSNTEIIKAVYGEEVDDPGNLKRAEAAFYNGKSRVKERLTGIVQALENRGVPTSLPLSPAAVAVLQELGQPEELAGILDRSGKPTITEIISPSREAPANEATTPTEKAKESLAPSERALLSRVLMLFPGAELRLTVDERRNLARCAKKYAKSPHASGSESLRKVLFGKLNYLFGQPDFESVLTNYGDSEDQLLLKTVRDFCGDENPEDFLVKFLVP